MNVVSETFDKQDDFTACQDYYYHPQYSPSITDTFSCHSSYSFKGSLPHPRKEKFSKNLQRGSPLTLENVSKVQLADPYNTPLARYCNEMETPEPVYTPSNASTRKTIRKPHEDYVLESPRLLPFPYHNDAYFLPTAEHDYPGGCSTTDASSSIVTLSVCTSGSRQHLSSNSISPSFCHPQRGYQRQLLSSPSKSIFFSPKRYDDDRMSNYSNKRRADSVTPSSPSTMREDAVVPQKKRRSNNKFALSFKRNLLRFKSNSPILEGNSNFDHLPASPSSSGTSNTLVSHSTDSMAEAKRYESLDYNTKSTSTSKNVNRSWFEKLWKFIKPTSPSNLKKRRSSLSTAAPTPVWYSQFRCNPPPPTRITLLS